MLDMIPDIVILDEVQSRQAHSRKHSKDLRLSAIHNADDDFSRTIVEQVQEKHKRSLL